MVHPAEVGLRHRNAAMKNERAAIAKALRDLADLVEKLPDVEAGFCAGGYLGVTCRTVDQFRQVARAAGLTMKDRQLYLSLDSTFSLVKFFELEDQPLTSIHVNVRIDGDKVGRMIERTETKQVWEVPDNLLSDDYEPPA
jgi:hypothetical protein